MSLITAKIEPSTSITPTVTTNESAEIKPIAKTEPDSTITPTVTINPSPKDKDLQTSDVYFLVIGSQHYIPGSGFKMINGVENSAKRVTKVLKDRGAKYGIELTSDNERFITQSDIRRAIIDLKHRIRSDNPANPLIFFYFMGHGLGDDVSNYMYLPPGNLIINNGKNQNFQTFTIKLIKSTVWNFDIIGALFMFKKHYTMAFWDDIFISDLMPDITSLEDVEKVRSKITEIVEKDNYYRQNGLYPPEGNPPIPFIAMFDNCNGDIIQDITNPLSDGWLSSFVDLFKNQILNDISEIENEGLVFYAAKPGTKTNPVDDPSDSFSKVGLLARRFMLALDLLDKEKPINLQNIRDKIENLQDKETSKPYFISATKPEILKVPLFSNDRTTSQGKETEKDTRQGTATEKDPVICCQVK